MTQGNDLRRRDLAGPAGLVLAAAALAVAGRRGTAVLVVVAAIVLLHAVLLSAGFRRFLDGAATRLGSSVGAVLSVALLLPVFLLVVTPIGLVLRAVGARPLDLARDDGRTSYWTIRSVGTDVRPGRQFTDQRAWHPAGSSRRERRRIVAGAVVATLLVQALAVGGWARLHRDPAPVLGGASSPGVGSTAALRDLDWVPETQAELGEVVRGTVYTSFTGGTLRDHRGRYVNVHDRMRRTYESPLAATGDPIDIWFFGGSTMFGFDAQRDEHTIPSEVVRLAEGAGIPVRARNYGAPGYVSYQEAVLLSLLVTGGDRPDLVVFYDGINDVAAQILTTIGGFAPPGEPADLGSEQQRQGLAAVLGDIGVTADPPPPLIDRGGADRLDSLDPIVDATVGVYGQSVDLSRALADRYDFEVAHFWQPDLYSKATLDPGEEALLDGLGLDPFRMAGMVGLGGRIRAALPDGVFDVSDALDDVEGPVLSDEVHVNEVGARAVAEAIFADLAPSLERLQDPSQ